MAKITLRIEADASGASATLANLKKEAASISGQKIDLGIDAKTASAVAKAASALAALQRAQNQAAAAAQKTAQAEAKASAEMAKFGQQIERTKQSQEKTAQSSNNLAIAQERTVQSANNLATAQERTVQSTNNLAAAQERTAQSENNLAAAEERTEQAHERTAQAALRLQTEQERTNRTMEEGSSVANALSVALGAIAARAFHMVISKITQGIREAVTTMKDVDTQLTNISKVSGITGKALSDMGERAYETASKYGVSADEYLSAVYTFQKAGLGESAEAMGELAVKTMLVGDTTADVASQFLISANAAWKFGGNIEDLNRIVDEADYINNNYATDLTKLSQGLPRVASVAAQAGMSAEETLAAIGTITAVTQESGTKAATALRALILNIEGQVGEFVDETGESFTVTENSVKSMQGLMEKYAKAELDAARASGELINPMTAIKAIFEGMANSDLNDQELFTLLSGMGGKLRTNQLTALVQNYELFDDMLNKIADSAGTADSEISLMMESWERKTQVLKNTWTEFIADFVDSSDIKTAISDLTAFIDALDKLLFKDASDVTKAKYKDLHDEMRKLEQNSSRLTEFEKQRLAYLKDITSELDRQSKIQSEWEAKNWQLKHGRNLVGTNPDGTPLYADQASYESLTAGWSRAGAQFGLGNINASEYMDAMKKVVEDNRDYYENLVKCKDAGVDLTDWQQKFVNDYEAVKRVTDAGNVSLRDSAEGYWEIVDAQGNVVAWTDKYTKLKEDEARAEQEQAESQAKLADAQKEYKDAWDEMQNAKTLEEYTAAYEKWEAAEARLNELKGKNTTATQDFVTELDSAEEAAHGVADAVAGIDFSSATASAREFVRTLSGISFPTGNIPARAGGTKNASGGPTLVNELGPELISDNGKAYIANGGMPAVVNLSKGAIVLPANVTKNALKGGGVSGAINAADGGLGSHDGGEPTTPRYTTPTGAAAEAQRARERAEDEATSWKCPKCGTVNPVAFTKCYKCGTKKPNSGGSGKKGGGGKSAKQRAEDAAKKLASLLSSIDKRASLADKEKRYGDEKNLYKRAISLIKKQLQRYKKAGFSDKSDEVVDLKSKLHDYEDKLANVNKTQWDAEIDAREQALREQRAQDQMAEKEAAVEKARQALENAQKQRNVRVFNAATGQWEWVADQGAVQRAQEQYESAQRTWTQAQEDAELDALRARRDAGESYKTPSLVGDATQSFEVADKRKTKAFVGSQGYVFGGAPADVVGGFARNNGTSDSHDTVYNFGNITLSEAEAQSTSVAELAKKLNVLKIS